MSISVYITVCLVAKLCLTLATPWTVTHQASLFMGFSRPRYWSGLPFPSPWDLLDPGIESVSSVLAGMLFTSVLPGKTLCTYLNLYLHICTYICICIFSCIFRPVLTSLSSTTSDSSDGEQIPWLTPGLRAQGDNLPSSSAILAVVILVLDCL